MGDVADTRAQEDENGDEKMNKRCNGSYGTSKIQLRAPAGNNIID